MPSQPAPHQTRILLTGLKRPKEFQIMLANRSDLFLSVNQVESDSIEASIHEEKSMENEQDMNEVISVIIRSVQELDEATAQMGTFTE